MDNRPDPRMMARLVRIVDLMAAAQSLVDTPEKAIRPGNIEAFIAANEKAVRDLDALRRELSPFGEADRRAVHEAVQRFFDQLQPAPRDVGLLTVVDVSDR